MRQDNARIPRHVSFSPPEVTGPIVTSLSPAMRRARGRPTCQNRTMAPPRRRGRASERARPGVLGELLADAGGVLQSVANGVAPGVVNAIDVNGVVERVDIQGVVDRVDLQETLDRVDLNELLAKIDLDAVLARADLDSLLVRIDLNALIDRVDVDALVENVDINAVLTRGDINLILARIDVNALIDKVDIDRVLDRVDLNAVLSRVDVDALVQRTELASIIATTGAGIISKVVDVARSEGVGLDFAVQRLTDKLLRRRRSSRPLGPALLVDQPEASLP